MQTNRLTWKVLEQELNLQRVLQIIKFWSDKKIEYEKFRFYPGKWGT